MGKPKQITLMKLQNALANMETQEFPKSNKKKAKSTRIKWPLGHSQYTYTHGRTAGCSTKPTSAQPLLVIIERK